MATRQIELFIPHLAIFGIGISSMAALHFRSLIWFLGNLRWHLMKKRMAAECLGGLLYGYESQNISKVHPETNEVVWVKKRYIPTDLRSNAPVPRSKFLYEQVPHTEQAKVPGHWKHDVNQSLKTFSRHMEEDKWYASSQATRCEEWSTLRQMFPSKGIPERLTNPRWGTDLPFSPRFQPNVEKRFPHINSPMTR